jgi:hypothetical protein
MHSLTHHSLRTFELARKLAVRALIEHTSSHGDALLRRQSREPFHNHSIGDEARRLLDRGHQPLIERERCHPATGARTRPHPTPGRHTDRPRVNGHQDTQATIRRTTPRRLPHLRCLQRPRSPAAAELPVRDGPAGRERLIRRHGRRPACSKSPPPDERGPCHSRERRARYR